MSRTLQKLTFRPLPCPYEHPLQKKNSMEKLMFRKAVVLGSFARFPVTKSGRNCQKAHVHTKTFHLSQVSGHCDHTLKDTPLKRVDDGQTDGHPKSIVYELFQFHSIQSVLFSFVVNET